MHDCSGPTDSHWDSVHWTNRYLLRKLVLKPPRLTIYRLIKRLSKIVISAYFGEVQIIGADRIPCCGPVIFVGNHNNQFVDAFLMMAAISRRIRFLIAAVSMKLPFIGLFARLIGAIAVNRPRDQKFVGLGKLEGIYSMDNPPANNDLQKMNLPRGILRPRNGGVGGGDISEESDLWLVVGNCNTRFRLDFKIGDRLSYSTRIPIHRNEDSFAEPSKELPKAGRMLLIRSIHSDRHMLVRVEPLEQLPFKEKGLRRLEGVQVYDRDASDYDVPRTLTKVVDRFWPGEPTPFKVYPKMDQGMVYEKVSRVLARGDCICIFPEGGSHDRPDLLPLKPGVAVFALQAYLAGVRDALIVPVGLHYFDRQRIGSAAVVDVGRPIAVSKELAERYAQGGSQKVEAVNDLLNIVRKEMQAVTITAESYHILQTIQRCSEVYLPIQFEPTSEVKHKLQSVFTTMFSMTELPDKELLVQADAYTKMLDIRGLQDVSVLRMTRYTWQKHREAVILGADWPDTTADAIHLYYGLISKSISLIICFVFALPALIISMPLRRVAAAKSTAAARASSVKIAGVDVMASTKIQIFLTCIPGAAIIAALIGAIATSHTAQQLFCLFPFYLFVTSVIVYYGLHLVSTVTSLRKQVQCCYTMCLSQASALESGGIEVIAGRNELQKLVRDRVKKAIVLLSGMEGGIEPCVALEAICPQYLIDLDSSERLSSNNALTMSPSIYKAMMSTRDEII